MTAVLVSVALVGAVLVALAVTLGVPVFALALIPLLAVGLVARLRFVARRRAAASRARRQAEPERVPGVVPLEVESDFWDAQPVAPFDWANSEPDVAGSDGSCGPPAFDEPTVIAYNRDGDQIWRLEMLARVIQNQPGAEPITPRPLHWRAPDAGAQPLLSLQPPTSLARGTKKGDGDRNREPRLRAESSNSGRGVVDDALPDLRDLIAQPFTQCAFRRSRGQPRSAGSRRCSRRA